MDLKGLEAIGAMVPRTLFMRTIEFEYPKLKPEAEWAQADSPEYELKPAEEWEDPDVPEPVMVPGKMDTWIRRGSSADAFEIANAGDRERPFVAIFRSVCLPNGDPVFPTLADAMQLKLWIALPLFKAINEVNGGSPKASPPKAKRGAKSRSPSAGGR